MTKFVAINRIKYVVPFVKKDDSGAIVENRSLTFVHGGKNLGKTIPAHFVATDEEAEYLKKYPTFNIAFKLHVQAEKKAKEASKPEPKKTAAKQTEPESSKEKEDLKVSEDPIKDALDTNVFPSISTIQQAGIKLRQLDTKNVKSTDVNSRAKVIELADKMGVSFPNLK